MHIKISQMRQGALKNTAPVHGCPWLFRLIAVSNYYRLHPPAPTPTATKSLARTYTYRDKLIGARTYTYRDKLIGVRTYRARAIGARASALTQGQRRGGRHPPLRRRRSATSSRACSPRPSPPPPLRQSVATPAPPPSARGPPCSAPCCEPAFRVGELVIRAEG